MVLEVGTNDFCRLFRGADTECRRQKSLYRLLGLGRGGFHKVACYRKRRCLLRDLLPYATSRRIGRICHYAVASNGKPGLFLSRLLLIRFTLWGVASGMTGGAAIGVVIGRSPTRWPTPHDGVTWREGTSLQQF